MKTSRDGSVTPLPAMGGFAVILFVAASCQGQLSLSGTLVTVIPASGGIVVAADTRFTVGQITGGPETYCDGRAKLQVPKLRKHTVVFHTGDGLVFPFTGHPPADSCGHIETTHPILDISSVLVQQVNLKPEQLLTKAEVRQIAERCRLEVAKYAHKFDRLHPLKGYVGQHHMFQAVIVSYDVKHDKRLVGYFFVSVDPTEQPVVRNLEWHEFTKADKAETLFFGETDYAAKYAATLGHRFFGPYITLFATPKTVSQVALSDVKSAAWSFIYATEQAAKSVKPPTGIGGPIDVATITERTPVVIERY